MISEKIQLLGKGLYKDIPDELTLTSIPTTSELDYVGGEDFDKVMLETILPTVIEEKIDFSQLLELDYYWICRCLRLLNFGPYHTTNSIFCGDCGNTSYGEYQVNLNTIECKALPEKFVNDIIISKDAFIDFQGDIRFKLPTIKNMLTAYKDTAFQIKDGRIDKELARMCYSIYSFKGQINLTPLEIKLKIEDEMSAADYLVLKGEMSANSDYGLRAGGSAVCPKCGSKDAAFIALVDDRFFRPALGDIRQWKHDRSTGNN